MKNKIGLNNEIGINTQILLQSRMVILANSGGGKSYAIRKFAEDAVAQHQTIIIDPEGEFSSLREKYDFILAGKGADVPVEIRSAALLATKLLELGKSAIIDLYELHPQERQRYVKLFFDAMVNAPKELYHPVFIVLDEAHEFAPEGKPSEATWSVEALASKGRKRGYCLIPASQRIAKLSKNLTAECNNKLIGRASQDIDMKRAGDELGFSKEKLVELRQLKPGEFFAFGPAISDEVIKVKIGAVKTTHAKLDYKGTNKVPPPSSVIKKVLGELAALPQEAEKEVKTIAELKAQVLALKTANNTFARNAIKPEKEKVVETKIEYKDKLVFNIAQIKRIEAVLPKIGGALNMFEEVNKAMQEAWKKIVENQKHQGVVNIYPNTFKHLKFTPEMKTFPGIMITPKPVRFEKIEGKIKGNVKVSEAKEWVGSEGTDSAPLGKGEIIVLKAIAQFPEEGITTEHIAVLTGYKQTSRRVYLQRLSAKGYTRTQGDNIFITEEGMAALGSNYEELPKGEALREHLMRTLPEGEKRVLSVIIAAYPDMVNFEEIENVTGYKTTSRRVYLQRLGARKLIEVSGNMVKASAKLYE